MGPYGSWTPELNSKYLYLLTSREITHDVQAHLVGYAWMVWVLSSVLQLIINC